MEALKRILNILSGLFILFALLLIFDILNRSYFITNFGLINLEGTYRTLLLVGVLLMALQLLVHALHTATLKAENRKANLKINELKADLYDKRVVTKQRERDAQVAIEPHAGYTQPVPHQHTNQHATPPAQQPQQTHQTEQPEQAHKDTPPSPEKPTGDFTYYPKI